MAAHMRGKAKGEWIKSVMDSMVQSNRSAASILYRHGCTACTDVTGFGLMGHLLEMIQYGSGGDEGDKEDKGKDGSIGVRLYLDDIPLLLGAEECVGAGILSSLHPQNIRCARAVDGVTTVAKVLLSYYPYTPLYSSILPYSPLYSPILLLHPFYRTTWRIRFCMTRRQAVGCWLQFRWKLCEVSRGVGCM